VAERPRTPSLRGAGLLVRYQALRWAEVAAIEIGGSEVQHIRAEIRGIQGRCRRLARSQPQRP
jgi:hypothetical protein